MSNIISITHIKSGQITNQVALEDNLGEIIAHSAYAGTVSELSPDYRIEWVDGASGIVMETSIGTGTKQAEVFCNACAQKLVWDAASKSWVEDPTVLTMPRATAHTHALKTFRQS